MISNSHFKSIVPREEAIHLMADSVHCLISIGNMNTHQLPSKVIEYLSTGKPVIHFAEVADDPVNLKGILNGHNAQFNFDLNIPSKLFFKNEINKYSYMWREGGQFS